MKNFAALCVMLACATAADAADWPRWLGPEGNGTSPDVPKTLPKKRILWRRPLIGKCHAGLAVGGSRLIVADHGNQKDFFRCYTADTGRPVWVHSYPNTAEIEYTSAPRATPLIAGRRVYTLGATGDLYCLTLDKGEVVWHVSLTKQFGAQMPEYGCSSAPVLAGGKLIINPGGPPASIAALDPETGAVIWKTPGAPAAYAGFLVGTFGGVEQVITYDKESLGGWDLATGARLWKVVPEIDGDFNVGTPVNAGGRILVSTDNNYLATNDDLALDMATPVILGGLAFGTCSGLVCVDINNGLKTLWIDDKEESTWRFSNIIAGNGRLLIVAEDGTMLLAAPAAEGADILASIKLCRDTWSHPALADGRLYIRDERYLYCYQMGAAPRRRP